MSPAYRIVVIDDQRVPAAPSDDTIQVELHKTLDEGVTALMMIWLEKQHIDELWLDHDLGFNDKDDFETIMPVVHWLEELGHQGTPLDVDYVFTQTMNPMGAEQILAALKPYYNVSRAELPVR